MKQKQYFENIKKIYLVNKKIFNIIPFSILFHFQYLFKYYFSYTLIKGGLISDIFHFSSNLQKKVPNHSPEQYPPKESDLATFFWIFEPK